MSWLLIKEPWGPLSRNQTHPRPDLPSRPPTDSDSGSGPKGPEKGPRPWAGQTLGVGPRCQPVPAASRLWVSGSLCSFGSAAAGVSGLCVFPEKLDSFLLVSGFCSLHRESMFKDLLGTGEGIMTQGSHSGGTEV